MLAFDIGASRIKYAVLDEGELGQVSDRPTPFANLALLSTTLLELLAESGQERFAISCTGVNNLGVSRTQLDGALERAACPPLLLVGDMEASAAGEALDCGGELALLQLGSGVGAGIVREQIFFPCALGHLVFRPDGIDGGDRSGMHGHVEAYLGWHAVRRRLAAIGLEGKSPGELLETPVEGNIGGLLKDDDDPWQTDGSDQIIADNWALIRDHGRLHVTLHKAANGPYIAGAIIAMLVGVGVVASFVYALTSSPHTTTCHWGQNDLVGCSGGGGQPGDEPISTAPGSDYP
jgi:hypothetical protein